jgi:hypothetical protein
MPPVRENITEWAQTIGQQLPGLSRPQAYGLALWSYGAQVLQCCGQSQVVGLLAQLLDQQEDALRQRLREWTWEQAAKAGRHRREVDVSGCFRALLVWVLSLWPPDQQRLALALDATTLGQRFVVLAISVLYGGCAIPIAWQVLPATTPGAWQPHWLRLLAHLQGGVPPTWCVLVLADRGLFSQTLFHAICAQGWHPLLRINTGGKCRLAGTSDFRPLGDLLPPLGQLWRGRVTCFKRQPLEATLVIYRDAQHADPWLLLTDLAPEQVEAAWYGLRSWIECQFKDLKRGGWHWQRTRMTDPARASRLWLVLAVALLYAVSLGGQAEQTAAPTHLADLPPTHIARRTATGRPPPRRLSLVTRGHLALLVALLLERTVPQLRVLGADPWPTHP